MTALPYQAGWCRGRGQYLHVGIYVEVYAMQAAVAVTVDAQPLSPCLPVDVMLDWGCVVLGGEIGQVRCVEARRARRRVSCPRRRAPVVSRLTR
jgi:hypothetical protein